MIADQGTTPSNLSPSGATWPDCSAVQGVCLAYDMGRYLGRDNLSGLLAFTFGAQDGAPPRTNTTSRYMWKSWASNGDLVRLRSVGVI